MSDFKDVFEANKNLSEDEVVMAIYDAAAGSLSLKDAQSEYRSLAVDAGLLKTPAQKKVEWEDAVESENLDISTEAGVTAAKAIGSDLDIGSATIMRYLKALADESGVTLAVSTPRAPGKWTEVVAAFTEEEALNAPREDVVAKINEIGEYDDLKKASSYYNRLRKVFGWEQPASMSSQLNDWFAENLSASKQDILDKGIELGMSEASAQYYVGVYKIVSELAEKLGFAEAA